VAAGGSVRVIDVTLFQLLPLTTDDDIVRRIINDTTMVTQLAWRQYC